MDRGSYKVYINTENIYVHIAREASNYELGRPFPEGKYKKVI